MSKIEIKTYEVLKPIGYGGRQEKGTVLSMPVADAEAIGTEYLVESQEAPTKKASSPKKEVSKMSIAELRAYAEELELDTDGSKADLVERITLHLEA